MSQCDNVNVNVIPFSQQEIMNEIQRTHQLRAKLPPNAKSKLLASNWLK